MFVFVFMFGFGFCLSLGLCTKRQGNFGGSRLITSATSIGNESHQ